MSLEQARTFIEKMKSDVGFRECIMATNNVEERLTRGQIEGFDCTIEDLEALQAVCIDPHEAGSNLPLTWQCKGPCHTKCAAVV